MRHIKRVIALFLVLIMLVPLVLGCSKKGEDTEETSVSTVAPDNTESLYDENGYLKDTLKNKK